MSSSCMPPSWGNPKCVRFHAFGFLLKENFIWNSKRVNLLLKLSWYGKAGYCTLWLPEWQWLKLILIMQSMAKKGRKRITRSLKIYKLISRMEREGERVREIESKRKRERQREGRGEKSNSPGRYLDREVPEQSSSSINLYFIACTVASRCMKRFKQVRKQQQKHSL